MTLELLESVLENGVANSHYFNGRILTADALRDDQKASRRQRRQLGRAIGAGIVCGLRSMVRGRPWNCRKMWI